MITLLYAALLRLYPWDYANAFSEEMKMAFEEACGEQGRRGKWHFVRFVMSELCSLIWEVGKEWLAKSTTEESVRGRSLPDFRKMRPVGIAYEVWFASLNCSGRGKSAID